MNCDECKEQVLELIERELVDPDGVRETLARCPDCRAEFDALRAALALAQQLPIERAPPHLDALILRAADARAMGDRVARSEGKVAALRSRRIWSEPLAMAAVALLVVGIGVSTVSVVMKSGGEQLAQAPSPETLEEASPVAAPPVDLARADEAKSEDRAIAVVGSEKLAARRPESNEPKASRPASVMRQRSLMKKEARKATSEPSVSAVRAQKPQQLAAAATEAEADAPQERGQELLPSGTASGKSQPAFAADSDEEAFRDTTPDQKRRCESHVSEFERRIADEKDFVPSPEEQLDAGLCYQTLGKRKRAQRWLLRAAEHSITRVRAKKALEQLD